MAVPADAPYIATRVSLYLHRMHASDKQMRSVCSLVAMYSDDVPIQVGRGAQHEVAIALGHQTDGAIRRAQGLTLRVSSTMKLSVDVLS